MDFMNLIRKALEQVYLGFLVRLALFILYVYRLSRFLIKAIRSILKFIEDNFY